MADTPRPPRRFGFDEYNRIAVFLEALHDYERRVNAAIRIERLFVRARKTDQLDKTRTIARFQQLPFTGLLARIRSDAIDNLSNVSDHDKDLMRNACESQEYIQKYRELGELYMTALSVRFPGDPFYLYARPWDNDTCPLDDFLYIIGEKKERIVRYGRRSDYEEEAMGQFLSEEQYRREYGDDLEWLGREHLREEEQSP